MKLFLTSNGLSNQSIADALFRLVGKPASETVIVFVPTAMNAVSGNKEWFIDDLVNIKKQGCKAIDIVDISALPRAVWLPRIEGADVLFFSGGNTSHLMRWLMESGLASMLPALLASKVYAGISAGSIATSPTLALSSKDKQVAYEEAFGYAGDDALGLVDFYVRPHYNSPHFPYARKEYLEAIAHDIPHTIYALDDQSALVVEDATVTIVSEGEYLVLNGQA